MRWTLTLAAALIPAVASRPAAQGARGGALDPPRSPRNASYTIAAKLDPSTHTIGGAETIAWRNISNTNATELQFHLYWNAWKDDRSTFMREAALAGRSGGAMEPSVRGAVCADAVTVARTTANSVRRMRRNATPNGAVH